MPLVLEIKSKRQRVLTGPTAWFILSYNLIRHMMSNFYNEEELSHVFI